MKPIQSIASALLLTLGSCGSQRPATQLGSDAWRADLRYLAQELPSRHANAFHTVSRDAFAREVAQLDDAIPRITGDEALVGLMRIVALIGDGHTHLDLPPRSLRYPIELLWFSDELRVVAAAAPYDAAVGARVLAIGSTPIQNVMERLEQLVPRGENDGRTRLTATMRMTSPEVLHGSGVIADPQKAPFVLQLASGERASITFSPAPLGDFSSWRMAWGERAPLSLQRLNERWWAEVLPDAQTVYFSFTGYPPETEFRDRSEALARLLDESHARRLVIDLRRNQGGDLDRFRRLLLPMLKSRAAITRKGGLFVITGPGTFSAAAVNALDLRNEADAILVGSPAGIRPNHYGEHREFRLPNSGLVVSYSTQFHRFAADGVSAIVPDRRIEPTWDEFRAGRDPVLEWILSTTN